MRMIIAIKKGGIKYPGMVILYLIKSKKHCGICYKRVQSEFYTLSKIFNGNIRNRVIGIQYNIKGYYLDNEWHKKRIGWIKLRAVININNFEIIDCLITDIHVNYAKSEIK